ncbi:YbaN family protein [Brachyspira pulli]|uniref:YbaN family protein n=1 Tax=Brachyspira pulli TaxID=310721 RepID=UPI003006962E
MRILFIILGFVFVAIGAVGIAVPILPTTPFLLLASFFFAKGSKKFHDWFTSTKLYKKHLESFVKSRAMTLKSKLSILLPVSAMLIITFIFVNNLHVRIVLVILFIGKYLYFFTQIKTIKNSEEYINNAVLEENNEMNLNNKQKL